jgi:glycosyltransferase involved in cell wall biosynthesis
MSNTKTGGDLQKSIIKKPHIVFLSRILPFHSIGGMQAIAWDLARQFVRDGIRVSFITTKIPNKPEKFVADGIEVIALKNTIPGRYSSAWWKYSREYFEKNFINSATGVLSVSSAANGLLPLKKYLKDIPFLFQAHGTSLGEILSKWRTLQPKAMISSVYNMVWLFKDLSMYNKYDYVVAVGERVYLDLTKPPISFFLSSEKVHLINNGIDTKLFSLNKSTNEEILQELGLGSENIIIISSSRLHKQKGIDLSIKGFAKYTKKNQLARYLIIGDGPELPSLKKLVKTLGISDKVFFLGAIDREKLPNYLQLGDVFLFTTKRSEGLPLNVLEAMAMGLPAIVSNHLKSVININTNNIIGVDPYDSQKIADLLAHVIDNREKYKNSLPYEHSVKLS